MFSQITWVRLTLTQNKHFLPVVAAAVLTFFSPWRGFSLSCTEFMALLSYIKLFTFCDSDSTNDGRLESFLSHCTSDRYLSWRLNGTLYISPFIFSVYSTTLSCSTSFIALYMSARNVAYLWLFGSLALITCQSRALCKYKRLAPYCRIVLLILPSRMWTHACHSNEQNLVLIHPSCVSDAIFHCPDHRTVVC